MGSNVHAHLLGQPSPKARTQLVAISKQGKQKWQVQREESGAGAPKHPHIAYYTAKTSSRRGSPAGTLPRRVKQLPTDMDCISSLDTAKSRQWFLLSLKLFKIHSKGFFFGGGRGLTTVKTQIAPYVLYFQFTCWDGEYLWAKSLFP